MAERGETLAADGCLDVADGQEESFKTSERIYIYIYIEKTWYTGTHWLIYVQVPLTCIIRIDVHLNTLTNPVHTINQGFEQDLDRLHQDETTSFKSRCLFFLRPGALRCGSQGVASATLLNSILLHMSLHFCVPFDVRLGSSTLAKQG